MKYSKFSSLVKFGIIIFILIAVYRTNGDKIKMFFSKIFHSATEIQQFFVDDEVPEKTTVKQEQTVKSNSDKSDTGIVENKLNNLVNKLLENPNFRSLIEKVLENSMHRQGAIIENDPAFERIITHDYTVGEGLEAACGDTVSLKYNLYNPLDAKRNPSIKEKQKQSADVTIGAGKLHMGLENSLIHMREKGVRTTMFLNSLAANSILKMKEQDGQNVIATDIELIKVIKKRKDSGIIVHSTRNAKPGTLLPLCAEKINFSYYIKDINGKLLHPGGKKDRIIELQPGPTIPNEVTKAIMSTPADKMSLTIIGTPEQIIRAFNGKNLFFPKNFQHPRNQLLVINLEALPKANASS